MVTFLFFDAAFTLFRPTPSVGYHYAAVARRFGIPAEAEALEAAFVPAWRRARRSAAICTELPYGRNRDEALRFWTAVVEEVFRQAGGPVPERASGYYQAVFDRFEEPGVWELYPDVEPALAMLERAGVRCGILSNFDTRLHGVVRAAGLAGRLSPVVTSAEGGAEKPSRRLFDHARALLTEAERVAPALVGDEPEADGLGALQAGWGHCLVQRGGVAELPPGLVARPTLDAAVAALLGDRSGT